MKSMLRASVLLCVVGAIACQGGLTPYDYSVDGDGAYTANLMRHYSATGSFTTAEEFASGNPNGYTRDWWSPTGAIDMSKDREVWYGTTPPNANATAALRWTLDQAYDIKKFVHYGSNYSDYEIRVSETGFSGMTVVVPRAAKPADPTTNVLATPAHARYIEYVWYGATSTPQVAEFYAFAAAGGSSPAITSADGFSLNPLISNIQDLTVGKWAGTTYTQLFNEVWSDGGRGVGSGDAVVEVTFPMEVKLSKISFSGDSGYGYWPSAKVEVSTDNIAWATVYSGSISEGTYDFATNANGIHARYIRITDIGGSNATVNEIQFFGFVPEPGTLSLAAGSALILALRRRRG